MRDAFCHDLCYSALLLVIVPVCEQQTFTSKFAVKRACCQAVVCTAALISEVALWQDLCCSALLLVIVPLCEQQTCISKVAVKRACCQADVCTAALISEGCTLAGSVLQCTLAGRIAFV